MTIYNCSNGGSTPFSDLTIQMSLITNVFLTYVVPGNKSFVYKAIFSVPVKRSVFIGYNNTAIIPIIGMIRQKKKVERNSYLRFVRGGDVLTFRTRESDVEVGLSLYSLYNSGNPGNNPSPPSATRITEDDNRRITENGDIRITE